MTDVAARMVPGDWFEIDSGAIGQINGISTVVNHLEFSNFSERLLSNELGETTSITAPDPHFFWIVDFNGKGDLIGVSSEASYLRVDQTTMRVDALGQYGDRPNVGIGLDA